jgi:S1-C subfamily serine protease
VKAQITFLSGVRTGQVETFQKGYVELGRHPLSDLRFDPDGDLDVSSHHAAIIRQGGAFVVRDLGSTNGTFVNGTAVKGDMPLREGDVIGFGKQGPTLRFHVLEAGTSDDVSPGARASAERMSNPREKFRAVSMPVRTPAGPGGTDVRIAAEVARQTRGLHRTTKVLLVLLLVTLGAFGWVQWKSARDAGEIAHLQARADSLNREAQRLLSGFQSELQSVHAALRASQSEARRLRRELAALGSSGDPAAVTRLRSQLDSAELRQRGLASAAQVDFRAISHSNADAIALVIVKFSANEIFSGTAFAVDSQGTMVTNKHVLVGEADGRHPIGIAVKFSGSKQWFQGRLLGVSGVADIGVFKVDIRGGTPRVAGFAPDPQTPQRGDPVAIIGYPLGEDLPMEGHGRSAIADPTLTVGTVSKVLNDLIQVDGYGAPGSSGSPIFGRDGRVVAVLYGGNRESQGKIIFAVPGRAVVGYLRQLGVIH